MLCLPKKLCHERVFSPSSCFRGRLAAKAAAAAFGAISVGATAVGAPAPTVVPTPTPIVVDGPAADDAVDVEWLQRLLTCVEYLCRLMGCAEALTLDDLNGAINQLALTVNRNGVPNLGAKQREEALGVAMRAAACADEHPGALGTNYDTLRRTLDKIVSDLASGRPS
jgi:hypothetical protein